MKYNLHTHTFRCRHASGTEEEYIKAAIDSGYTQFGFADHSPMPFPDGYNSGFRMKLEEADDYFDTLSNLKEKYKGKIDILLGVEAEYYPEVFPDLIKFLSHYPIDYMIMGQHFVDNEYDTDIYSGDRTTDVDILHKYVNQVIEGMETGCYTYVAHPDLVEYVGDDDIYRNEMIRICREAKTLGLPLEVNILGLTDHRQYPCDKFFKIASEVGNDIVIGLDAHSVAPILNKQYIKDAEEFATRLGLNLIGDIKIINPIINKL